MSKLCQFLHLSIALLSNFTQNNNNSLHKFSHFEFDSTENMHRHVTTVSLTGNTNTATESTLTEVNVDSLAAFEPQYHYPTRDPDLPRVNTHFMFRYLSLFRFQVGKIYPAFADTLLLSQLNKINCEPKELNDKLIKYIASNIIVIEKYNCPIDIIVTILSFLLSNPFLVDKHIEMTITEMTITEKYLLNNGFIKKNTRNIKDPIMSGQYEWCKYVFNLMTNAYATQTQRSQRKQKNEDSQLVPIPKKIVSFVTQNTKKINRICSYFNKFTIISSLLWSFIILLLNNNNNNNHDLIQGFNIFVIFMTTVTFIGLFSQLILIITSLYYNKYDILYFKQFISNEYAMKILAFKNNDFVYYNNIAKTIPKCIEYINDDINNVSSHLIRNIYNELLELKLDLQLMVAKLIAIVSFDLFIFIVFETILVNNMNTININIEFKLNNWFILFFCLICILTLMSILFCFVECKLKRFLRRLSSHSITSWDSPSHQIEPFDKDLKEIFALRQCSSISMFLILIMASFFMCVFILYNDVNDSILFNRLIIVGWIIFVLSFCCCCVYGVLGFCFVSKLPETYGYQIRNEIASMSMSLQPW